MANLRSSKKDIRRIKRRTKDNNRMRVRVKRAERAFNDAITEGNQETAKTSFDKLQKSLDKATKKGVIKKGNASRRKSRLSKKLNTL